MSIHEGHRQRLKDRYRQDGLDSFPPVNVLELLLFYCVPRRDTNPIAHRLLDRFGSVAEVLDADPAELMKIEGITENAATFLSMLPDVYRYYRKDINEIHVVNDTDESSRYLADYFVGHKEELVYLLCLDAKYKILCCREIARGSVNSTHVSIRKIVEVALNARASVAIVAHNHPNGFAIPSSDDVRTTYKIASALRTVDVILADHLIFSDDDSISMAQSKYYSPDNVD